MDGYRTKPWWIRLLGVVFWLNTVFMPLQVMIVFGHPPTEATAIWAKLTAQNKVVMALSPVAATGVQTVTPWGWGAALALLAAALFNNLVLLRFPSPFPVVWVYLATAAVVACGGWLLRPVNRRLFREAGRHWWKTPLRYRVALAVELERSDEERVRRRTVDISRTGVFVEAPAAALRPGERVRLRLGFGRRRIRCGASVIRYAGGAAARPEGFGLRFEGLRLGDRFWLRFRLAAAAG